MEVREVLIAEITIGWGITLLVTGMYGIVAPWYKVAAGRYIFGLLLSLTAVLSNTVFHIFFPDAVGSAILAVILFAYYVVAVLAIGIGIYRAQINGYRKKKFVVEEKERHRQL